MIERIAAVIASGVGADISSEDIAAQVLAAMREPTQAMFEKCDSQLCYGELDVIWKSMIDGALK